MFIALTLSAFLTSLHAHSNEFGSCASQVPFFFSFGTVDSLAIESQTIAHKASQKPEYDFCQQPYESICKENDGIYDNAKAATYSTNARNIPQEFLEQAFQENGHQYPNSWSYPGAKIAKRTFELLDQEYKMELELLKKRKKHVFVLLQDVIRSNQKRYIRKKRALKKLQDIPIHGYSEYWSSCLEITDEKQCWDSLKNTCGSIADFLSSDNAFAMNKRSITFCPASLQFARTIIQGRKVNGFTITEPALIGAKDRLVAILTRTIAHELAHQIDGEVPERDYKKLAKCFESTYGSDPQELVESVADYWAIKVISVVLKNEKTLKTPEDRLNYLRYNMRGTCRNETFFGTREVGSLSVTVGHGGKPDLHPKDFVRIGLILGRDPEIRGLLGCGTKITQPYCSLKGRVDR